MGREVLDEDEGQRREDDEELHDVGGPQPEHLSRRRQQRELGHGGVREKRGELRGRSPPL